MEYALELSGVTKAYPDFTLADIGLLLPTGCIMGFIGENGAGKTTTIKAILDLVRTDRGSIRVLGRECPREIRAVKEQVGVVLEDGGFPEQLTPRQVGHFLGRIYRTWAPDVFTGYLDRFHVPDNKRIKELSLGMKKKLAIAAALSHDARLLLLDEATSGLDPVLRAEVLDVFLEFIEREDRAILFSSHILSDLEKAADYITFLHQGRIVFSSEKDRLLERYGLFRGSQADLSLLPPAAVRGARFHAFGVEALVERQAVAGSRRLDPASIEEIMLYSLQPNEIGKEASRPWPV